MFNINFADDWNRTSDLWYWKQQIYQLSHNHCPNSEQCVRSSFHVHYCLRTTTEQTKELLIYY